MSKATYEDFIDLQAAIVRADAKAWRDEHFKKRYLENPLQAISGLFTSSCHGNFPFTHISVKILDSGASNPHYFDAAHTGGWVGKNDEVTFYLPPPPEDKTQRAEALAAYNQLGLMGVNPPKHK